MRISDWSSDVCSSDLAATKPMAQRIWLLKPCAPGVSPSAETAALQAPAKRSKDGLLGVGLIMAVLLMLRSRSVAGVALAWLGGEVLVVLACLAAMLPRLGRRQPGSASGRERWGQ